MSGAERLAGLVRPRYDGASNVNLAVSVARAAGMPEGSDGPPMVPPLAARLDPFGGRRAEGTVVFLLVDALGAGDLARWAEGGSSEGARWQAASRTLTTVFPSTTTSALTSLSTGVPPGRHGLVGHRQFLPRFGVVAELLKMSAAGWPGQDLLVGPRWTPAELSGAPTLFRRGLRGAVLTRDQFKRTGFTRLLYDGAEFVGYSTATDLAHELGRVLARPRPPPVVYVYWDELDTVHHLQGPTPALAGLELDRIAQLLAFVARQLPVRRRRRTRLIVTGDHGQVPSTLAANLALDRMPEVQELLDRPFTGDRRAGFLAVRRGREAELRRRLAHVLPVGHRILRRSEALRAGLFGPPPYHPELEARTGDLIVLVPSPYGLTYLVPGAAPPTRYLLGAHGGLEPEEMEVPGIDLGFAELADPAPPRPKT